MVFGGGVYLQVTEVPRMMLVSFLLRSMYAWLPIHRHCYCGNDQSFDSRPRQRPVSDPYTCQHKERPKPAPYHDLPTIETIADLQVLQHNAANVSRTLIVLLLPQLHMFFSVVVRLHAGCIGRDVVLKVVHNDCDDCTITRRVSIASASWLGDSD